MAQRAIGVAIEKFLAMRRAAGRFGQRLNLHTANVGDDLPDLFIRHANALAVGSVRRHRRARNPITDHLKHLRVGMHMLLLRPRQVRTASASMRPQPMTKRTVDAEFILSRLSSRGVACKRIAIIGRAQGAHNHEHDHPCAPASGHGLTFGEFAAFYAKQMKPYLWKSWSARGPAEISPVVHVRRASVTCTNASLHLRFPNLSPIFP